jgi:hypothetical protein
MRGPEQNERFLARFHTKEINVFMDLSIISISIAFVWSFAEIIFISFGLKSAAGK